MSLFAEPCPTPQPRAWPRGAAGNRRSKFPAPLLSASGFFRAAMKDFENVRSTTGAADLFGMLARGRNDEVGSAAGGTGRNKARNIVHGESGKRSVCHGATPALRIQISQPRKASIVVNRPSNWGDLTALRRLREDCQSSCRSGRQPHRAIGNKPPAALHYATGASSPPGAKR